MAFLMPAGNILSPEQDGQWEQTLDVDLRAQMVGTRLAALAMQKCGSKGEKSPHRQSQLHPSQAHLNVADAAVCLLFSLTSRVKRPSNGEGIAHVR